MKKKKGRSLKGIEVDGWVFYVESFPGYWLLRSPTGEMKCLRYDEAEELIEKSTPALGGDSAVEMMLET